MKRLFCRQSQLESLTKVCRSSYISSCVKAVAYGSFIPILLQAWFSGEAFFLFESYSESTVQFVRTWVTLGFVLTIIHFFVTLEQIPKYLTPLESEDPKYDLKKHLDCIRWVGVMCGFVIGTLISFWSQNSIAGADSNLLWSVILLMVVMILAIGKDFWRMSGLSPNVADQLELLVEKDLYARKYCMELAEHRPFVDVDFDLLVREMKRSATRQH
ncbi:hypothetical protein [Desulfogranum japonicum]|uniref:hypothetical protein n=1 Tax=Desulfogranum japonicum TaxID=231447 RepID=UPI00048F16C2|nr:hypothetical protein [Desulfogranum japonicum]